MTKCQKVEDQKSVMEPCSWTNFSRFVEIFVSELIVKVFQEFCLVKSFTRTLFLDDFFKIFDAALSNCLVGLLIPPSKPPSTYPKGPLGPRMSHIYALAIPPTTDNLCSLLYFSNQPEGFLQLFVHQSKKWQAG